MRVVAGVDEAGRGPLAGPVIAAAVLLAPGQHIDGVRDSKQLSARRRAELAERIRSESIGWAIGSAGPQEIDAINILQATLLAMRRAVEALRQRPDAIRIDGNRCPALAADLMPLTESIVGGDRVCPAISAASIIAKVHRDGLMRELHERFPGYGFDRHKGYPTAEHRRALIRLGPCAAHRMSFRPVREFLEREAATVR